VKASSSFDRLSKRLWNDCGIRLDTKAAVYKAAVLSVLLFGWESWTLYRRHISKLDQFHMKCLRQIAHITSSGKTSSKIQKSCRDVKLPAFLLTVQLRRTKHVVRMDNNRLSSLIFYGQLQQGERRTVKTVQNPLKANLTMLDINPAHLESRTADRTSRRALCLQTMGRFEDSRVSYAENRRLLR